MKNRFVVMVLSVFCLALVPFAVALADGLPPANAKPLSAILTTVQQQNTGRIAEADFDHGRWEVTMCHARGCQKYYFNPVTGAKEGQRGTDYEQSPSTDSKSIVTIVQRVEAAKIGIVTGIDFDHGHWKVELAIPQSNAR